ncbi:ribbon-helix-helix domain-containing protein [Nocardia iowensis]|uniref:Ribbon-helix-helix domain-containing protein n=1 Tax=Nocardia iowensis TaxID=204891 RepID=A0ABX8RXC5_NOCIO|nr:ribbon-helix-helix domain-containing protein [Nocardia iowensis]QXN94297.1 ribbon-helix-helix domain-containing protein [Nocardia iowensis]
MTGVEKFTISLPTELAAYIQSKVESGNAATRSAFIADTLRRAAARDHDLEVLANHYGPEPEGWTDAVAAAEKSFSADQNR